ncbi:MAG: hypothetical protein QOH63_2833 [Acidobacteriota bacterium]|jgi:hypothetical protein|nr:hypothetical protein [Acidobacteriota bacterium]
MQIDVSYNHEGSGITVEVEIPDECPTCGRLVVFPFNGASLAIISGELQTVHHCPNKACTSFMVCYHTQIGRGVWKLKKTEPPKITQVVLPDFAGEISPNFVFIYKESVEAKERGLAQIAGPGYRKAFEFLIKDYAKSKSKPEEFDDIENLQASPVVNKYITDSRVQAVAKRALWIGNDETHYLRRWEDRDINDLITLIKLTLEWIDIERQSAAYIEEMPDVTKNQVMKNTGIN